MVFSIIRAKAAWAQVAACTVLLYLVVLCGPAEAREGYAAFAKRVTANPPAGIVIRPDLEPVVAQGVNRYRRSKGLPPLRTAANLVMAARAHAIDLALHDKMGHVSSGGMHFDSRIRALRGGAMVLPSMAENAARDRTKSAPGQAKSLKLVSLWIGSPGHRRNMVNRSFIAVATGVVQKGNELYAVQIFTGPEVKSNMRRIGAAGDSSVY